MTDQIDIVGDLMTKAGDDVTKTIMRTLAICPKPHLPVALAAAAAAIGIAVSILDDLAGNDRSKGPNGDNILLAGLLAARTALDSSDGVGEAYRDFDVLRVARRTPSFSE
jgi:hypothetical protein